MENRFFNDEDITVTYKGQKYEIEKLNTDISDQMDKPEGTVVMTHKITGFEVPLYYIQDNSDETFMLGYKVVDNGEKEASLFVSVNDAKVYMEFMELVNKL
jgi:hypothetical protein